MIKLYASCLFGGSGVFGKIVRALFAVVMPLAAAVMCYRFNVKIEDDLPSLIISAFSIFSAMLFASQVAAFSVFNYKMLEIKPDYSDDEIVSEINSENFSRRAGDLRSAFRRINAGISVLTLIAVSISALALSVVASPPALFEKYLTTAIFLLAFHFLASFILTCLHVFSLFDSAYLGEEI